MAGKIFLDSLIKNFEKNVFFINDKFSVKREKFNTNITYWFSKFDIEITLTTTTRFDFNKTYIDEIRRLILKELVEDEPRFAKFLEMIFNYGYEKGKLEEKK